MMDGFWKAAAQDAGRRLTREDFQSAVDAFRRQWEARTDAGCPHLFPAWLVQKWRDEGRTELACPGCGALVRIPPGPAVPDVAVPPGHDPS